MARPVQTTLHDVAVYVDGCIASRRGRVELEQGCNRVYIAGISAGVRDDSLRLRFDKGVTQGQIRVVEAVPDYDGLLEEDAEALRTAHALDEAMATIQSKIDACDVELALWRKNGEFSYTGGSVTPADAIAYMEQLPRRLEEIGRRKRGLVADLKLERARLDEHMRAHGMHRKTQWEGAAAPDKTYVAGDAREPHSAEFVIDRDRDARYVQVELWAQEPGAFVFELQYWQVGATWRPLYEVEAGSLDEPVDLRMRAHITQTTKEDWRQVAVRLRTGNPSIGGRAPSLRPWYVDLRRNDVAGAPLPSAAAPGSSLPKARRGGVLGGSVSTMSAAMDYAAEDTGAFELALERAEVFEAQRSDRQTMVEYELPGLWDIESGVDGQIVDLERREVAADFHCFAFPLADDAVYLSARIEDAAQAFPLDGEVSSYVEGALSGRTQVDAEHVSAAGFELPFGRADRVRVQRRQVLRKVTTLPLRNVAKIEFAYEILVANNRPEAVDIVVIDQVPLSRDAMVVVETGRADGAAIDDETGEVRWELSMASGEQRALRLEYSVGYPKKERPTGLAGPDYRSTGHVGIDGPGAFGTMRCCVRCGRPLQVDTRFCPYCGSLVQ